MTREDTAGRLIRNEKGIALVAALLFLMVLTLIGTTAIMISSTDIKIGGNYKNSKTAFYQAEAGVQYAIKAIENELSAGTLTLPPTDGSPPVTVSYTVPSGFSFDSSVSLSKATGVNEYTFQMNGYGGNNSRSTIEVRLERGTFLDYGVFGDQSVDMKNSSKTYSYDSRNPPSPWPADFSAYTTHEADVGSNGTVAVHTDTYVDGDVALGARDLNGDGDSTDAGENGSYSASGTPIIQGTLGLDVDHVDPDPLGAISGTLATKFTQYQLTNDNGDVSLVTRKKDGAVIGYGLSSTTIETGGGGGPDEIILEGKPGGANYYITDIDLKNGTTLTVDATNGPVNIYLHGPLEAKEGSSINLNGLPTDFTIYSNTSDSIVFKHASDFKGTVYAPLALIDMRNDSEVFGLLWGSSVERKNNSKFYFDAAIKDKFASNEMDIISWREVR